MKAALIVVFAIFLQFFVLTAAETVVVTSVHDGDSFRAGKQAFRLWGIDAPELDQRWGIASRDALRELLTRADAVMIERHGTSWKRIVVRAESGRKDVSLELLKMGLAWYCPDFAPKREDYREAEREAREARRGLWSDKNPVSPAEWRINKKDHFRSATKMIKKWPLGYLLAKMRVLPEALCLTREHRNSRKQKN